MQIDVISIFPPMFEAISAYGVTGRAIEKGLLQLRVRNPRDFATDARRTVDDRPYGGGPGMVMMAEPLAAAIHAARAEQAPEVRVIYLSPQGRRLDQAAVTALAARSGLILLAGRYEGVDERLLAAEVDEEWSIGDYVLSGGELPAMVMIDAVARLLPGVLGHADSGKRIHLYMACWIAAITRGPRCMRAARCQRCCCPATMSTYGAGVCSRRWDRPG